MSLVNVEVGISFAEKCCRSTASTSIKKTQKSTGGDEFWNNLLLSALTHTQTSDSLLLLNQICQSPMLVYRLLQKYHGNFHSDELL